MLSWKALTVQELTLQWVFQLAKLPAGICSFTFVFFPPVVAWLEYPDTSFLMHNLSCSLWKKIKKIEWLFIKVHGIEIFTCHARAWEIICEKCVFCFSHWRIPWLWPCLNPCPSFSKLSFAWWSRQDHLECISLEHARGLKPPKPLDFRISWHIKCCSAENLFTGVSRRQY